MSNNHVGEPQAQDQSQLPFPYDAIAIPRNTFGKLKDIV